MSVLSKNKEKIVGVLSAFFPWIKPVAAAIGIGGAAVVASNIPAYSQLLDAVNAAPDVKSKVIAAISVIVTALAAYGAKQTIYWVKDLLDNGKLDGSAPKE